MDMSNGIQFLLYSLPETDGKVQVVIQDETIWCTQKAMAQLFGKDYFRELLERVRSIRASERRIWQQITDIFAECSIDYDKHSPTTKEFYAIDI